MTKNPISISKNRNCRRHIDVENVICHLLQPVGTRLVGSIFWREDDQNHPFTVFGSKSGRFSQPLKSHKRPDVQIYGTSLV